MLRQSNKISQQYYLKTEDLLSPKTIKGLFEKHYSGISASKLVVTSRLHVATACLSWGVPVILSKEKIDYRFSWIGKHLPIFSQNQFHQINWEVTPKSIDTKIRQKLRKNAIKIIQGQPDDTLIKGIHQYYKSKDKFKYENFQNVTHNNSSKLASFLEQFDPDTEFRYALWGITSCTDDVCKQISSRFSKSTLVKIIDEYSDITFNGIRSEKKRVLSYSDDFITICIGVNASNDAQKYFESIGKSPQTYCLLGALFV